MSNDASEAIVEIIGYGQSGFPRRNEIGIDNAVRQTVDQIFEFASRLTPDWTVLDLSGAGDWAKASIAGEFPFLTPNALDALAWSCTYGWK